MAPEPCLTRKVSAKKRELDSEKFKRGQGLRGEEDKSINLVR